MAHKRVVYRDGFRVKGNNHEPFGDFRIKIIPAGSSSGGRSARGSSGSTSRPPDRRHVRRLPLRRSSSGRGIFICVATMRPWD